MFAVCRKFFVSASGSTCSSASRDIIAVVKSTRYHDVPKVLIDAVVKCFEGEGIDVGNSNVHLALSEHHCERAESL